MYAVNHKVLQIHKLKSLKIQLLNMSESINVQVNCTKTKNFYRLK